MSFRNILGRVLSGTLILIGASTQAASTKAYGDFAPHNSFDYYNSACVNGPAGSCTSEPNKLVWIATPFTPSSSGPLDHIDAALSQFSGQPGAIFVLVTDNNGVPEVNTAQLETWVVINLPDNGTIFKPTDLSSKVHPTLTAGQQYWLIYQPLGFDTETSWNYNSIKLTGHVIQSSDAGATWSFQNNVQPAFDVYVRP